MKKSKIIVPALGVLVLSTAASISGTVAWFTANNSVAISGMQVQTKVSSNLLIAQDTLDSTAKKADSLFESGPFSQTVKGILEPVSTVDGKAFFYTTDAKADGDAKADVYTQYGAEAALEGDDATNYDNAFSKAYGIDHTTANATLSGETGAKPYVDYVFQLRAQNSEASPAALKVTNLTLTYSGTAETDKAFRVAFFAEDITAGTATAAAGTLKTILRHSDSQNFDNSPKAVASTSGLGAVTYNTAANLDASIASGATKYYKVVTRLWLEGEDKTCNNNTFATLTGSWALTMTVELGGATAAVSSLTTAVTPAP